MRAFRHALKEQNILYIFVAVLFLVGVIFGALMVNALSLEQQQDLGRYLGNFFVTVNQGAEAGQPAHSYWDIAGLHLKWVGLIWILGLSVIGLPGILILDFLKGVLVGFTVGYLVGQFSWHGLLFALVSVAPPNLLIIPVLIVCSVSAIAFSLHIIKNRVMLQRPGNITRPFASYVGMTLVMGLIMLGISSFETWVTPTMMRWVTPMLIHAPAISGM
ncbi:stage II sporulation protein M [Paenibacillus sp. SSG-1]|jgi:stage II sporulation protein M|uniref:Stage II sporulation protein M n=1 Tax=Paenibacillus rhizosphaerae TaxID=297318 RepID=A0A839TM56_9BACL|nr:MULTISPECIES: stage II sporulation protein M [Paenibacillus]MBB3127593.1 stage II sporulation protein M [Paenibacillus rhizosphaerae]MBJ9988430.1 stage II sporulation protein M [Paenibacillus sp. S28]MEC0176418.1 stage II sporulation protein M [Paenibacillus favisporus]OXL84714.1 stage II sporulation protein M [Paenibacillus sp. SSG-1]